jgi:polyisoprenoid-binding protein YceI
MILCSRSLHTLLRRSATAALLGLLTALANAQAQARWVVDPKASLAWWQVDPNMAHLWATTCPQEPSWRPGEGRSGGWSSEGPMTARGQSFNTASDTIHVPLYPRRRVRFVCTEAIHGQLVLPDTVRWRGAHGQIVVNAKDVVTGENMRDVYAHNAVLGVHAFPNIKFTLDSLVDASRRGDTLRGTAVGTFELRGATKPVSAAFKAYPEAGGTRVLAKFGIPARSLMRDFAVPRQALGLGVVMDIWKTLFMGVDLLLRSDSQVRMGQ